MSNLAEKNLEYLKKDRRLYLASEKKIKGERKTSFYIITQAFFPSSLSLYFSCVLWSCLMSVLGCSFVSYDRQVFELERMISLEEERSDRLNLKIAELRSPNRMIPVGKIEEISNMQTLQK
jgi:cell division protein FtsL